MNANDKSWMTPLTKMIINEKWQAYRTKNWEKFHHLKTKARKEIIKAKTMWAKKLKESTHGLWKMAKHLSGKQTKNEISNLITQFKTPTALAERIAENMEINDTPQEKVLSEEDGDWNLCFTTEEVEKELRTLSQNKAAGADQIPNKVYALLATFIASPLRDIFQNSIAQRSFPMDWKKGIVVPIPKTQPPLLNKLRTITLLPYPSKILEKLVLRKTRPFFDSLSGNCQHAFRKDVSTTTALIHIVDTATLHFDDASKVGHAILSLDFTKAFDMVDHHIILNKAKGCLPEAFRTWLRSYLSGRTFRVKVQGQMSKSHPIAKGVPQGSVLGPVLFATLVGDLSLSMTEDANTLVQYADDANIIIPLKSKEPEDICNIITKQISAVQNWCTRNKQQLNMDKTKVMLCIRGINKLPHFPFPTASSIKVLGVVLNDKLKWDEHLSSVCKKASQRLHLLRTLKLYSSQRELHSVYTATVRVLADYCCPLFVRLPMKLTTSLQKIEKRAHRIIYEHLSHRACNCELDGLKKRRENYSIKFMLKLLKQDSHILSPRMPKQLPHTKQLTNFFCRTTTRQNSFIPYTTIIINNQN
jgi:hypothetical protein